MVLKPTTLPMWAETDVLDPTSGQYNVVEPPTEKKTNGWSLGEQPARNFFNWLGRFTYRWLNYLSQQDSMKVVTDTNGVGLFPFNNAVITLVAVDLADSTKYINAFGIKLAGSNPTWSVTNAAGLSFGAATITGNQAVTGGANVIISATSSVLPF